MASLTKLSALHGFPITGDIDTDGYVAVIPAFQKVYFADGRDYNEKGFHKLDFLNTKIVGTADAAFQKGEAVSQASSGASGVYDESTDVKLTGNLGVASVPFILGEKVTQAATLAIGYVVYVGDGFINVCTVSRDASTGEVTDFELNETVTGETSGATMGSNDPSVQNLVPSVIATSGTFTMTFDSQTTGSLAYDATTGEITTALEALSTIEEGAVTVGGQIFSDGTDGLILTFIPEMDDVSEVTVTSSMSGTLDISVSGRPFGGRHLFDLEITEIATSGTYTITYDGETTAALNYDASTGDVTTAVDDLSNTGPYVFCSSSSFDTASKKVKILLDDGFTGPMTATSSLGIAVTVSNSSDEQSIGPGRFHFIYRTTTTEFDEDNDITGALTGSVLTPLTAADENPDLGACIQHLYPDASGSSGTFTLTYEGQETAAIDYDATTGEITTAINLLSTVTASDIVISGTTFDSGDSTTPLILTFLSTLGSVNLVTVTESMGTTTEVLTKILQTGFTTVTAPPHWLTWKPVASWVDPQDDTKSVTNAGIMPDGGSNIGVLCFGRIFLNSMSNPHQWFCTRINDPLDFDQSQTDVAASTSSQNTPKAGLVGSPIIAMVSYKDHYLTMGCTSEVYIMRSDPLMGGVNTPVSKATGFFSPVSWNWDDQNNLYFLGIDGIYRLTSSAIIGAQPPENLTKQRIPKLISSIGLNRRTDRVVMAYDKQRYGILVSVTQKDGGRPVVFWIDLRTGGLFPDKYPTGQSPASMLYYDSYKTSERGLLLGGYDGYIRKFDETAKDDEGSNTIESFFTVGPFLDDSNPRNKIITGETSLTVGEDTDGITVEIFRADSADELVKNVIAGATAAATKTLTGDGLQSSIRDRVSGRAVAMKYSNTSASESFSIEEINTKIIQNGKEK